MRNWKFILGIVLVFLLGVATGVLGVIAITKQQMNRIVERGPEAVSEMIMRRLDWELKLTEEQRSQVEAIVQDTQRDLNAIRAETRPRVGRVLLRSTRQIRALLTPEQADRFDQRVREGREKLERFERSRGGLEDIRPMLQEEPSGER